MTWLGVLLTLAITLRVTRLITLDAIAQPFRDWVTDHFGTDSKLALFVHCPWCVGWWVAIAAAFGSHYWAHQWGWQLFATVCAMSWLTAMAQVWLDGT